MPAVQVFNILVLLVALVVAFGVYYWFRKRQASS